MLVADPKGECDPPPIAYMVLAGFYAGLFVYAATTAVAIMGWAITPKAYQTNNNVQHTLVALTCLVRVFDCLNHYRVFGPNVDKVAPLLFYRRMPVYFQR